MALESAPINTRKEFCAKEMSETIDFTSMELIKTGYENTKTLLADSRYTGHSDQYPVIIDFLAFKEKTATPAKSSGWYIPSFEELKAFTIGYYGFEETAKSETFAKAVDAIEGANTFVHLTTSDRYLLSSTISKQAISPVMFNGGVIKEITRTATIFNKDNTKAGIQGQIRAILTILE